MPKQYVPTILYIVLFIEQFIQAWVLTVSALNEFEKRYVYHYPTQKF